MPGKCSVCKQSANQQCGSCKTVFYCSRAHQRQHWQQHKVECSPFTIETSESLGRHMVASRYIKAGEVILKEKPLVLGPKVVSYPLCLGCHQKLKPSCPDGNTSLQFYKCVDCGWPLCAPQCQSSAIHHAECQLMKNRGYHSKIAFNGTLCKESAYCTIAPLRCLLLQPSKLENLFTLESHLQERIDTPLYRVFRQNIASFIRNVLGLTGFLEETILKIAAILDTNAFEIRRMMGDIKIRGLYPKAAMLSHDCMPNTRHTFTGDEFTLVLYSTVDIQKGDIISATYTQTLWGTMARRMHLQSAKCFSCACVRCSDPTELETYLGAIICSRCHGYITSTDPLNNVADWQCERCGYIVTERQMAAGNEALRKEVERLQSVASLEHFIDHYLDGENSTLHPTNGHILQAKYALSQLYGNMLTELTAAQVDRRFNLLTDLLIVADSLDPGLTRFRGLLLYDMHATRLLDTRRQFDRNLFTEAQAQESMKGVTSTLQEAAEILKFEPDFGYLISEQLDELAELCK